MSDETDAMVERATAELIAIPGALERAREGSAQARRGEVVTLEELGAGQSDAGSSAPPDLR